MKKRLTHITPLRAGVVLGILYGILGLIVALIIAPVMLLTTALAGKAPMPAAFGGAFIVILIPVLYALIGFIGGIIMAALYNLIAKWTGGLEFELSDVVSAA
jgi:uncharacterized protein YacL